jgi:hypothetical protein
LPSEDNLQLSGFWQIGHGEVFETFFHELERGIIGVLLSKFWITLVV